MTWFSQALPGPWVTGHLCRGFLSKGRLACGSREQVEEWRELRDSHCGSRMELVTSQQERLEEEHAGRWHISFWGCFLGTVSKADVIMWGKRRPVPCNLGLSWV